MDTKKHFISGLKIQTFKKSRKKYFWRENSNESFLWRFYKIVFRRKPSADWGQLQFALEGLDSQMQPNYAPKSSIQDLHEDKQSSSKWGLMEEEKLRSSPGSAGKGNNKKMFPLANEDSNFFWPDTTDLFNLDSPRLQAPENLPTPITVFEIHTITLISENSMFVCENAFQKRALTKACAHKSVRS